jgi:hypothetical protein
MRAEWQVQADRGALAVRTLTKPFLRREFDNDILDAAAREVVGVDELDLQSSR